MKVTIETLMAMAPTRENVIVVNRHFTQFTGSLEAGMMLGQLLYWSPMATIKGGWIAKKDKDWAKELSLNVYSVRRATKSLVTMGIIEVEVRRFQGTPTNHYRLVQDVLLKKWKSYVSPRLFDSEKSESTNGLAENEISEMTDSTNPRFESNKSYNKEAEITAETTQENTASSSAVAKSGAAVAANKPAVAEPAQSQPTTKVKKAQVKKNETEVTPTHRIRLHFEKLWSRQYGADYCWLDQDYKHAKLILNACGRDLGKVKRVIEGFLADGSPFLANQKHRFALLLSQINTYLAASDDAPRRRGRFPTPEEIEMLVEAEEEIEAAKGVK